MTGRDVLKGAVPLPPEPGTWPQRLAQLRAPRAAPIEAVMAVAVFNEAIAADAVPEPCEVCGVNVAADYIARTGRARHGHHPAE